MGNFYTNVVTTDGDLDAIAALLEHGARRAYVAATGRVTVMYDAASDEQDLADLEKLAITISRERRCSALAVCNHDDDVLWYVLVDGGTVTDLYNSWPEYFEEGGAMPEGGDAERLCAAFGVDGKADEVEQVLHASHEDFVMEVDRHVRLMELLELPAEILVLGYRYVSRGELPDAPNVTLRAIGDESESAPPALDRGARESAPASDSSGIPPQQAVEGVMAIAALAFHTVDVPARFASVLGEGQQNGYAVVYRLQLYIITKRLGVPMGLIRSDEFLAELLGEREFPFTSLPFLVARAFHVSPFRREDIEAMGGPVAFQQKLMDALKQVMQNVRDEDSG